MGDESDVGYAFVKFSKLQEAGAARKVRTYICMYIAHVGFVWT